MKYGDAMKYQSIKGVAGIKGLAGAVGHGAILLLMIVVFTSCAGSPEVEITDDVVYNRPMPKLEHEYTLGPGDVLEIVYHYTPKPDTKDYILSVADVLKVEFAYHPDMNRELTIRPDGSITMPRKGAVRALGMTTAQLQDKIEEIYSKEFIDPVVTVTMIQYNRTIDRLKTAITTSSRGQSKLTAIRPDGYVSFPVISDIMASGKTLPELKRIITKQYQAQVDNLTITLILKVMKANVAYIFGEILNPDMYLMDGYLSVSQLVSRAGGLKNTAERSTVLIISRDKHRKPWGRLVNLEKVISDGDISQDVVLKQYDIVYVPKSHIARANLIVEQWINNMIPETLIGPYDLGGTLIQKTIIE